MEKLQEQIEHKAYQTLELFWDAMFKTGEKVVNMDDFDIHNKDLLVEDLNSYYQNLVVNIPNKPNTKVILYESKYDELSNFSQVNVMKRLFGRLDYYKSFNFVGMLIPIIKQGNAIKIYAAT